MESLFTRLTKRVDTNARHAMDVYRQEVREYGVLERDARSRAAALEYTVWLRRRTIELAEREQPLGPDDLALMASVGRQRAEKGLSLRSHQQLVVSHTSLMLREIQEATEPGDGDDLMRLMRWFGPQGTRGGDAYTSGHVEGQGRRASLVSRVRALTEALLADDPAASHLAHGVGMRLHPGYLVAVVRLPAHPCPPAARREKITEALVRRRGVPIMWRDPGEVVALTPADPGWSADPDQPVGPDRSAGTAPAVGDRALSLVCDVAEAVGGPCAVGVCAGSVGALAEAFARARGVSRVAPMQDGPRRLHTLADVFLELGVARLPEARSWLRDIGRKLADGPDLIATLETYYRSDMNRARAAVALNVHPRTLDYRLQRARELTGIHPGSTHGVRVLSVAVNRALSGGPPAVG
ncbi:CdaR family transcriptional regulator [Streptomyces sp. 8P21H-1]|uniref:PucR family transcriptional regulator n=1 Tax=Streptomyces sp. 8P21H-1 TaxID=2737048 RepID=UPI0015704D6F|nr:helix-turn-helix domain-containing protein [Streptomyces sp. 8P21H-1]NSL43746.1 helix-turn-helix domain-containing protein [Streptomyces sp. 8P21H-1]